MTTQERSFLRVTLSRWAVVGFGLLLTYFTYAPGLMPPDAQDQLRQAETGDFVDWHPPIMAWLWSQTNQVLPGPQGFFIVLLLLYWGGFFLIIRYASRLSIGRQLIASILPFLPILFNFAGTIWKDVLVFGCFLVALGIALLPKSRVRPSIVSVTLAFLLLLIGSLARYNSVLAAVPIVVLLIWPQPPALRPLATVAYQTHYMRTRCAVSLGSIAECCERRLIACQESWD